jgi:hypothetical protein
MVNSDSTVPVRSRNPGTISTFSRKDEIGRTAIQRGTSDIVVFAPPLEIPLANDKLEYEPDCEPGRVVDASCRRDEGYTD